MSWQSSIEYERIINEAVQERLGGTHTADLVIRSFDFAVVRALQEAGDWDGAGALLADAARRLVDAGAELLVLCTNTMHRMAPVIEDATPVPLLHIGDVVAGAVRAAGVGTVGLLGTRLTMEADFYRGRLEDRHGLKVVVPDPAERLLVDRVIFEELVRGVRSEPSRRAYLDVIDGLVGRGAGGIIAGCTEIELLVGPDDVTVPYFPTTRLHALAAVEAALAP